MRRRLLFISGLPRSGTTWLADIIGQHSKVNYLSGEFLNPGTTLNTFGLKNIPWLADENKLSHKQLIEIKQALLMESPRLFWAIRINRLLNKLNVNPKNYLRILKHFYFSCNNKPIFTKDPTALFFTRYMIHELNAKVLFLNRNPFSFAASMKRVGWEISYEYIPRKLRIIQQEISENFPISSSENRIVYNAAIWWKIYEAYKKDLQETKIPFLEIAHEDFIQSPRYNINAVLDYFELEHDKRVEKRIEYYGNFTGGDEKVNNHIHEMKRSSSAILTSWKNRLTDTELKIINSITGIDYPIEAN